MPTYYERITGPDYRPGDLFSPVLRGESGAYVDINRGVYALSLYSSGFLEAASRLGKRLILNDGCVDTEIYPLVYLYRHGIELAVKYVHCLVNSILERNEKFRATHEIADNFASLRDDLQFMLSEDDWAPRPDLLKMEQIIADLVKDDPKSLGFRYPRLISGEELVADLGSINIVLLAESLEYVKVELENITQWLEEEHPAPLDWNC